MSPIKSPLFFVSLPLTPPIIYGKLWRCFSPSLQAAKKRTILNKIEVLISNCSVHYRCFPYLVVGSYESGEVYSCSYCSIGKRVGAIAPVVAALGG